VALRVPAVDIEERLATSGADRRIMRADHGPAFRAGRILAPTDARSMDEVTVFISYSHDSDAHRARVLGLSERLRKDGIPTILDRYVEKGSPPEGWPRWMLSGLNSATHVLCISTETYRRRFLGQEVANLGKGVDWEGALLTQALYDSRSRTNKFVPVIFTPSDEPHIPEPLRGQTCYVLDSESGYQALYDALLNQSGVVPGTVGALKRTPRAAGEPLVFDGAPSAPAAAKTSTSALTVWRDKLEFLLVEDAVCVDPGMKFRLKYLISEAQEKIRALRG
jgi:SEFIR domain